MRISDWSSDVCSSDLKSAGAERAAGQDTAKPFSRADALAEVRNNIYLVAIFAQPFTPMRPEIGRASCRERVCQYVSISVVAVSLKKKQNSTNVMATMPKELPKSLNLPNSSQHP